MTRINKKMKYFEIRKRKKELMKDIEKRRRVKNFLKNAKKKKWKLKKNGIKMKRNKESKE